MYVCMYVHNIMYNVLALLLYDNALSSFILIFASTRVQVCLLGVYVYGDGMPCLRLHNVQYICVEALTLRMVDGQLPCSTGCNWL